MNALVENQTAAPVAQSLAGKYLSFSLQPEFYAIQILKVKEIIKLVPVTQVPQLPGYVRGVINLRGKIIPVLDLRMKFSLEPADNTETTCIVVVQVKSSTSKFLLISLGLVVDAVEEVLNLNSADIEDTPDFAMSVDTAYILGMAKIKGRVISLLDIDRVVHGENLTVPGSF